MIRPGYAYYNENDKVAAQWLRNLIRAGMIAPGDVDERSILEVTPRDLKGYTQCHFFAGIGIWSYALRCAGWSDDRPVWTGSCPCQPFSQAGNGKKFDDERHLFPHWASLIREHRPAAVFGEQVGSPDGLKWWDTVAAEFQSQGYAAAVADLCAAGVGSPHIRQRLYFVAEPERSSYPAEAPGLVHTVRAGPQRRLGGPLGQEQGSAGPTGLGDGEPDEQAVWASATNGFWKDADWCRDRDDIWRPVEPGLEPLVDGSPARVGRLRAYGNAIVAPLATEFVKSYLETL